MYYCRKKRHIQIAVQNKVACYSLFLDFHVHCASCDYKFENLIHAVVVVIQFFCKSNS